LAAVAEAKGRVTKSELKQLAAGQFNATLNFEVPPDAAGPIRDRLRQIGRVVRLEIDRVQQADGGAVSVAPVPRDIKITRGDAQFLFRTVLVSVARLRPRETTTLAVEVPDVDTTVAVVGAHVAEVQGRQVDANVAHERAGRVTARLIYDVPLMSAEGIVAKIK